MIATLLILLAIIVILLSWLLLVPVYLVIDTSKERYEIFQPGVFKVSLLPGEMPFFRLRIFGVQVSLKPDVRPAYESAKLVKKKKKAVNKSPDTWLYLLFGMMMSFQLKRFNCSVDTNDVVLNAQLYPFVMLMSRESAVMTINFRGQNYLDLEVALKVYRVCWTLIRFLTKK